MSPADKGGGLPRVETGGAGVASIEIVSASAGSGKTYRLTEILRESLASGEARPEAIVAVTFTTRAAAELQERARRFLVESGRSDEAQRLAASRISTVHSVCGGLLSEFAFDMGLSPEQNILDDAAATSALLRARSVSGDPTRSTKLADLRSRMKSFDWDQEIKKVLDRARPNGLTADDLRRCRDRSIKSFRKLLDAPMKDTRRFERGVLRALEKFLVESPAEDTTGNTVAARSTVRLAIARLRSRALPDWDIWAKLARLETGKASKTAAEAVIGATVDFRRHPQLRADLETAIELVFDAAAEALDGYQAYKRQRGTVDFTDQLTLTLAALRKPEIREQLRGEIDLFLVDEFQDTNPLQLAIFLELSRLAKRTVWVGDQKQSIFGFIGTDPALMDAAIEAILGDKDPETLPHSYRSRPELVHLTSDLFAAAFEQVGIPARRTRLAPVEESEPQGLGPIVERWRITPAGRKAIDLAAGLASGVHQLLGDSETRVRVGRTGRTRQAQATDVAVLCRTHVSCLRVADALAAIGVPSVVARRGLLDTPEARLVVAGLERWVDDRDSLAAASLARLAAFPPDGREWLEEALRSPYAEAFKRLPIVETTDRVRKERPGAGVLEAFDRVAEAVGARDRSAAWGATEQRLANLDALRSLVVAYLNLRSSEGSPTSVAGLLRWLAERVEAGEDKQAQLAGQGEAASGLAASGLAASGLAASGLAEAGLAEAGLAEADLAEADLARSGAVIVSTWHGAKGLEWPITILFDLAEKRQGKDNALGVHVTRDGKAFDFANPLADRWLRYWPNPFHPNRTKTFLHDRLAHHPENLAVLERQRRERLRLLYVGWTRARDRVVLATRANQKLPKALEIFRDARAPLLSEPDGDGVARWAGRPIRLEVRELAAPAPSPQHREGGESYVLSGPREHPPSVLSPSGLSRSGQVGEAETIGEAIRFRGSPDMNAMGEAFHAFFAADLPDLEAPQRSGLAARLVAHWRLGDHIDAGDLLVAADNFRSWIEARWPGTSESVRRERGADERGAGGPRADEHRADEHRADEHRADRPGADKPEARWRREWPIQQRLDNGTTIRGSADLVLELEEGFVLIDHKSYVTASGWSPERIAALAGQLGAYAEAIATGTGREVLGRWVHLPMAGAVVEIRK